MREGEQPPCLSLRRLTAIVTTELRPNNGGLGNPQAATLGEIGGAFPKSR